MGKDRTGRIPQAFEAVALIDGPTCAAIGQMSITWWLDKVSKGEAPQPVIRAARCTRWRAADVHTFWQALAAQGCDARTAALLSTVNKATVAAKAKRAALTRPT